MSVKSLLIDKTIRKIELLFRYTGINIRITQKTRADTGKSRIVYTLNIMWIMIDVIGAVLWFFTGLTNSVNFTELTYVAPCITISLLGTLKSILLTTQEKNVYKLIKKLRQLEIEEYHRNPTPEVIEIMKNEHHFVATVIRMLNIFYPISLVGFALSPFLLMTLKYFSSNELELLLPFPVVYPFNPYDIRYWPFVYIRQMLSAIAVVMHMCSADYLFYIFCTYIRMQFKLLKSHIEIMIPSNKRHASNSENNKNKIIQLIRWHQEIIGASNLLETVYTRSTLLNFGSSSILICLTGFNVVVISDIVYVATFLMFLSLMLLQIFFICFFGDLLMTSSTYVSDAVYNSRWYLTNRSLAKYLLIVQTRAQTPCKLTASNYSEVNIKAFMTILSTSWSYFALLQTLYGAPK